MTKTLAMCLFATQICLAQQGAITTFAPGEVSRPDSAEAFGSLSPDGQEFYYTIWPDWNHHRIVVSRLIDGRWSTPVTLPFSGSYADREPKLSPDGRRLYFSSNRPISPADTSRRAKQDLWMVERGINGTWMEPQRIDAPVNTDASESCPVITSDGTLYFISSRPGSIGSRDGERSNVWRARPLDKSGTKFSAPENLGAAINTGFETNVFVSADGRTMLVSRDSGPEGLGGDDLYVSYLVNSAWTTMRHLPAPLNSTGYDYGPSISADGRWLFFTSGRTGRADIYRAPASLLRSP
jgi:Tol biopolymer transport system component